MGMDRVLPKFTPLIRAATTADLPAINQIYNHYVAESVCTYQEQPDSIEERERWFKSHGAANAVIVAEVDGDVVGFGALSPFRERSGYRFTVENLLYVKHEVVGRGIGTELLRELVRLAQLHGHHAVIAVIDSEQESSLRLHERQGFLRCAHLRQAGFKFGRWLDVIYLELLLKSE